jgi:hypothetical protein
MMVRRTLLLMLFALWQGGFMFYGAIVVPVGARVLESETEQGFITQQVTQWLNGCGFVALACWLWELLTDRRRLFGPRAILWTTLFASLVTQVTLHRRMGVFLDADGHSVVEPERFYSHHRVYLMLSTMQWAGAIALLTMTLNAWAQSDRRPD